MLVAREGTTIEFARSKTVHRGIPMYRRMSPLFLAENRVFRERTSPVALNLIYSPISR